MTKTQNIGFFATFSALKVLSMHKIAFAFIFDVEGISSNIPAFLLRENSYLSLHEQTDLILFSLICNCSK